MLGGGIQEELKSDSNAKLMKADAIQCVRRRNMISSCVICIVKWPKPRIRFSSQALKNFGTCVCVCVDWTERVSIREMKL
jgi:hypothetical protein